MNDPFPDRAAVIGEARALLESAGVRVLDQDWKSGEHQLTLAGVSAHGVFVTAEIRIMEPGDGYRDITGIGHDRIRQLRRDAAAWIREHGRLHEQIRVDVIAFTPDASGRYAAEHIEGVG